MRFSFFLQYGIILILLPAVFTGFYPGKIIVVQTICWGVLLYLFAQNYKCIVYSYNQFDINPYFLIYACYAFLTYFRGFFNIDSDADVINLVSGLFFMTYLLPIFLLLGTPYNIMLLWKSYIKWGVLLCIVCCFYPPTNGMLSFQHNMAFLYVFILCIPFIQKKFKILLIIAAVIITVSYDLNRRSILINNVISFMIVILYHWILYKTVFRNVLISLLVIVPILLFIAGALGIFNIFKYMESSYDYSVSRDVRTLTVDSRTGIYKDVLSEIDSKKAYIWGLGGNGKTKTSLKGYRFGRPGTESGMLNHIQYGGLIGFISYGLLLAVASFKASKSKNDFMRMLSIFIAFKFLYSFIADQVMLNANTVYLFLCVSMCYNVRFREMSNRNMIQYLNIIFR